MLVKDFFRLVIKLFALYSLIRSLFHNIPYATSMFGDGGAEYWVVIIALFAFMILLFLLLIYSTDSIVGRLDLDRGFISPTIEFGSLNDQTIIKMGCIIIGGLLIVDHVAFFLSNFYLLFRQEDVEELGRGPYVRFASDAFSLLIGYLLLTRYAYVSNWLVLKKEKENG